MLRRALVLTAMTAVFLFCCGEEAGGVIASWDGGGNGFSWSDPDNWEPNVVPYNTDTTSYSVSINNAHVVLSHGGTIGSLHISGDVSLWSAAVSHIIIDGNGVMVDPPLDFVGANESLELSDIHISHYASLANYGSIDFQHRSMIKEDLINYGQIEIHAISKADIEGELTNNGSVAISHSGHFNAQGGIQNQSQFGVFGGIGGTDGTMNNNSTGILTGFGLFFAEQQIVNAGQIVALGGSLAISAGGDFTNTGLIQSTGLSPLLIKPYMAEAPADFHNSGTIDIRTGGGVAFDCNLVNDPCATIRIDGGTLTAHSIQHTADANLIGFGQIAGNLLIGPAGATVKLTGPTNIVGDVNIMPASTLEISDGQTLITGHTVCDGTIHLIGGMVIFQGGCDCEDCNIINEPGTDRHRCDFNADGIQDFKDFACFAESWLWRASWY